jgi:serine/threonine protein kinase
MVDRVVGGRYELVRPLGRGGMGEVWLGRDNRLDRDVAVKLLRPSSLPMGSDVEALISRFAREARLTARLENPGVPAVYDTGTDNDDFYLVMQVIDGADLAEFSAENEPVPLGWVAAIGAQIASILGAAHEAGLVHRDLKPRNVMITHGGDIKVLDFGIAVLRDPDLTRITRTAEAVGTPAYMAPEQAMHGMASHSSDLYSLGCVLYELITGRHVFEASTALAIMHKHYSEIPLPVNEVRPEVDPRMAALVTRLLAKDPRDRPISAREVYDVLIPLLPAPSNGPLIPMDPTRPFRDLMSTPQRPSMSIAQQPTGATMLQPRPVALPPPHSTPSPRFEPPTVRIMRVDTPARRMTEGSLIAAGFLCFGFALSDLIEHHVRSDVAFGVGFGVLLIAFGARMRKRRLGLPTLLSVSWSRATRPASAGERIMEKFLLILGGLMTFVYGSAIVMDLARIEPWSLGTTSPTTGMSISLALFIPGVLMRQRRLGRRYPWLL